MQKYVIIFLNKLFVFETCVIDIVKEGGWVYWL